MAFVAIKMGRRSGSCQAAAGREQGAYLNRYVTDPTAAGQPPAHFHRNPPGRGQLAVFLPPRRIDPYEFRYGRFARALKNSQLAPGESHVIYGTGHLDES